MKVVINRCFGGFGLSDMAIEMIMKRKGLDCYRYEWKFKNDSEEYTRVDNFSSNLGLGTYYSTADLGKKVNKIPDDKYWYYGRLERTDEDMIAVIEEIGDHAYYFNYDWRIDPFVVADEINATVERMVAETGHDKINIACCRARTSVQI